MITGTRPQWMVLVGVLVAACAPPPFKALADGGVPTEADSGTPDAAVALPAHAFEFVSQTIPAAVVAQHDFTVSVTVRNTGTATWSRADGFLLGSEHPRDNVVWAGNRLWMTDGDSVAPGATYTFTGTLHAPSTGGTRPMQWQMLQDAVEWFGAPTPLVEVLVECPTLDVHLRAANGQYVTAEDGGGSNVNANRSAAGPWETFQLETCAATLESGAKIALKTSDGHFLSATGGGGAGFGAPGTSWGGNETLTLALASGTGRISRGSLVSLGTANGDFVCAEGGGGDVVNANRTAVGPWETFKLELAGGPPARTGVVTLDGSTLHDDGGDFDALGATLFSAARWYKFDRPRLERALAYLQANGYDYFRALGTVAWSGKEIDPSWPDYAEVIAGVTDLAYDQYGLRVEWTIFGDAQLIANTTAQRQAVVDKMLQMSRGREHKIILFETANEYWANGFGGAGVSELRTLTRQLKDNTTILVAASAPTDWDDQVNVYQGGVADVMTLHHDRAVFGPDGSWRPVRQVWGAVNDAAGSYVAVNNEPIGPGSSVNDEKDPVKLVMAAVTTYVANSPFYTFHSRAGVGSGMQFGLSGDQELSEMPGADAFQAMKTYLPADLAKWTRQNHYWAGHPFRVFGDGVLNNMTTDGAQSGCMRAYASTRGNDFVVAVLGIKNTAHFEAKAAMEFDVLHPITGAVLQHLDLAAGQGADLSGVGGLVLKGHNK